MARRPTSHYLTERISQRDGDWLSTSARQYDFQIIRFFNFPVELAELVGQHVDKISAPIREHDLASRATISGTLTSSNCPAIDSRTVSRIASILTST